LENVPNVTISQISKSLSIKAISYRFKRYLLKFTHNRVRQSAEKREIDLSENWINTMNEARLIGADWSLFFQKRAIKIGQKKLVFVGPINRPVA
jgi:hypothetical protein